ncbi:hypothetical protein BCR33DRAFT_301663 [Rhizoclosmatium globosum]|uniref:Uncharacterized protein n=1 Tax=Rhizoclosmatium globosum TaxID=329046 RepID=A0A1Y2C6X8_9FUNG|nr:hypothetical protein BCR33DRAFT_301663 [Rhizoclosmatium globosum]|eukprot:ORY42657.1 hypothetical protein BCR33DRAFT_301663 [Rhizoclosmatium globosum]
MAHLVVMDMASPECACHSLYCYNQPCALAQVLATVSLLVFFIVLEQLGAQGCPHPKPLCTLVPSLATALKWLLNMSMDNWVSIDGWNWVV